VSFNNYIYSRTVKGAVENLAIISPLVHFAISYGATASVYKHTAKEAGSDKADDKTNNGYLCSISIR